MARNSAPELVVIQGAMKATAGTTAAWKLVLDDLADAGYPAAYVTAPAGANRDEAMVLDMWRLSPLQRRAKYGVPLGGSVAKPKSLGGNGSVHEGGKRLDIGNLSTVGGGSSARGFARIAPIMERRGFVNEIPGEPWHWVFVGTEPQPVIIPEGNDMFRLIKTIGSTTADARYDAYTDEGTLSGLTYSDARAYNAGLGYTVDNGMNALDGTLTTKTAKTKAEKAELSLVVATRALWAKLQAFHAEKRATAAAPAFDYDELAKRVKVPTAAENAAEVVRQLKLPGN